jgi:hypothetical protein
VATVLAPSCHLPGCVPHRRSWCHAREDPAGDHEVAQGFTLVDFSLVVAVLACATRLQIKREGGFYQILSPDLCPHQRRASVPLLNTSRGLESSVRHPHCCQAKPSTHDALQCPAMLFRTRPFRMSMVLPSSSTKTRRYLACSTSCLG